MSSVEKFIYKLQGEMTEPAPFGWFHLLWIGIVIVLLAFLFVKRKKYNEKWLKWTLGIYGIGALVLELLKQIIWSFEVNPTLMTGVWKYPCYIFPFQLCSTPIYICLICLFLKDNPVRKSLLSYLAYITIWGSLMTMIIPDSCLVETILVNIHTMYLHCGSFVVSVYLLMTQEVKLNINYLLRGLSVFLIMMLIALILNLIVYPFLPVEESFNMFYISPYYESELPVFVTVQKYAPYVVYLLFYIFAFIVGAFTVLGIGKLFHRK